MKQRLRCIGRWLMRGALLLVVVVAFLGWPRSVGGQTSYSIVSGHSMNPTYHTGDLIVLRAQRTYRVGQIVVYRIPAGQPAAGMFVVHRIVGGSNVTGFVTKGDNNPSIDIWTPHNIDIQGSAVLLVPQAGWVLRQGRDPLIYAVLGGLYMMRLLWPKRKAAQEADMTEPTDSREPADPTESVTAAIGPEGAIAPEGERSAA